VGIRNLLGNKRKLYTIISHREGRIKIPEEDIGRIEDEKKSEDNKVAEGNAGDLIPFPFFIF